MKLFFPRSSKVNLLSLPIKEGICREKLHFVTSKTCKELSFSIEGGILQEKLVPTSLYIVRGLL